MPHKHFVTLVAISTGNKWLMAQRPNDGLLGGLWEFPGIEVSETVVLDKAHRTLLSDAVRMQTGVAVDVSRAELVGSVKHAFTHFKLSRRVMLVRHAPDHPCTRPARWVNEPEISSLALTRSDQKIRELVREINHRTITG